ncbi:MAG TPA: NrfD/PsrC family molybdoenzyme membrane anchor subunit [Thermomicrobiales bacterium]|nr:NrfD/PsrC family molybdoenzyme membrane anchor subunit [Thermomicrobiales bacterium]
MEPSHGGYYDIPVIHGPHWKWLVIGYFYFGGISGASAVIAAFSRLYGGASGTALARIATYVSFLTLLPCPVLLILDLGRPARFFHMLRRFRVTSPMSVGTWGLTMFGAISTLATGLQLANDRSSRKGDRPGNLPPAVSYGLSLLGGLSGFFVAGYTGVLLAATAVPLWSKRPALLGPLFLSSAMTSGAAAIIAIASATERAESDAHDRLRALETISTITEEALLLTWIVALGSTAKPIVEGRLGGVVRHGAAGAGMTLPLIGAALTPHLPRRLRRPVTIASAALTLAGVFAVRSAIVIGGRLSADDPGATFDMTG